ncbi:unnamed protein product [Amoebophrya sp. A120]|nr:unnamed protein product [Amoebophrya sp. A120]|eukprot:GSA120T00017582001.1
MDLGFAAVNNPEEWGDDSPAKKVVEERVATDASSSATAAVDHSKQAQDASSSSGATIPAGSAGSTAAGGSAGNNEKKLPPPGKMHGDNRTRYFIIKCNNHKNLVSSIQNNVWATQRHNEKKLNEALRVAPFVVLLFSVNMSGSFQGYARMVGKCGASKSHDPFNGFGSLFDIKWLKLHDLDFNDVAHVTNEWNNQLSVKISRDGQELPFSVGKQICEYIDRGVFGADPDNFVEDEEEPNPVPSDAPPVGEPIFGGDQYDRSGKNDRKGKGKYGKDRDHSHNHYNSHNSSYNSYGSGSSYGAATSNGHHHHQNRSYIQGPYGGTTSYVTRVGPYGTTTTTITAPVPVAQSTGPAPGTVGSSWGTPAVVSNAVVQQQQPQYAAAWGTSATTSKPAGGTTIVTSSSGHVPATVVVPAQQPKVVQVISSSSAVPAGATVISSSGPPPPAQAANGGGAAAQGGGGPPVPGQPDFVNMSYDQYQKWYSANAGSDDEGSSSEEKSKKRGGKKSKKSSPVWLPTDMRVANPQA